MREDTEVHPLSRRSFTRIASAAAAANGATAAAATYRRADASWFAACRFGVSTHWTALSQSVHPADWRPFPETVTRFDVERFVDQIAAAGAEYLIFTSCHALQWLAGPCDAIERVLAGRTVARDMVGDLARACRKRGLYLVLYYNHSSNHGDDPAWEYACGFHEPGRKRFVDNILAIIKELGERHGERVKAWWFDSCFTLDPDRPAAPGAGRIPWDEWVGAAKSGYRDRLVTLSAGMLRYRLYTDHQDYEAGEANDLVAVPAAQFTPDGLQAHRWICLDNPDWVHQRYNQPLVRPRYDLEQLTRYVRTARRFRVPVTFNIDVDRNGQFLPETLALLRALRGQLD